MAEPKTAERLAARRGARPGTLLAGVVALAALAAAGCSGSSSPQAAHDVSNTARAHTSGAPTSGSAGGKSAAASATPTPTGGSATPADCPAAQATYASCGFPTAKDTGWASAGTTSLRNVTSPAPTGQGNAYVTEVKQNGAVINGINLTGSLDVWANNVTIENSTITTRNWWGINQRGGHHGLKIVHCTIIGVVGKGLDRGGEDYGISNNGTAMEAAYNNIYGFGEGITAGKGYFHDNYVHNLQSYVPIGSNAHQHTNGFIDSGGSGIDIVHNTFLNWMPPRAGGSSGLMLANDSGPVTNATVEDNWIAGGSYCLYPGAAGSKNVVISGNFFSTEYFHQCGYFGLDDVLHWVRGNGDVWHKNIWANGSQAGQEVNP
jgi:hypothetical protein